MLIIKKIVVSCLIAISILLFSQSVEVLAYDFELHSGLGDTGYEAGYDEAALTDISVEDTTGKVIRMLLSYIGVFFLVLTIYAGFIWMLARGNEQEIEKVKKILQNAIIGLIVVLLAYAITYLVTSTLTDI